MEDYFAATAGLSIERTLYMEVDVEPSQQIEEAEYVIGDSLHLLRRAGMGLRARFEHGID